MSIWKSNRRSGIVVVSDKNRRLILENCVIKKLLDSQSFSKV